MAHSVETDELGELGELDELDERELLFNLRLEGELDEAEVRDFDERLRRDPEFARAWESFREVMGGLAAMPFEFAPPDFVEQVQSRIRTRSRGRFFAEDYLFGSRVPYEVVAIVMIAVMAAAYLLMGAPHDTHLRDVDLQRPTLRR